MIENFGEHFDQGQDEGEELVEAIENQYIDEDQEEESGVWEAENQIDDDYEIAKAMQENEPLKDLSGAGTIKSVLSRAHQQR